MLKPILKRFVGNSAWFRLTQFKSEFRLRNTVDFWDPELGNILSKILPPEGRYVDVGAHDGRSSSNTFGLEQRGWTGVLIEPVLSKYFRILQLRSIHLNEIFHAACVGNDYKSESVPIMYGDLMSFSPSISEVNQLEWIEGSKAFLNSNEVNVLTYSPARTLNSILAVTNFSYFDFLSIDVEGAEKEVLRGLDLDAFQFGVICIEAVSGEYVEEHLGKYNYKLIARCKQNFIFARN